MAKGSSAQADKVRMKMAADRKFPIRRHRLGGVASCWSLSGTLSKNLAEFAGVFSTTRPSTKFRTKDRRGRPLNRHIREGDISALLNQNCAGASMQRRTRAYRFL